MSAAISCPACHHSIFNPELHFCAACGAPICNDSRQLNGPSLRALENWTGLAGLLVSQEAAMSYWFMARSDYAHLTKLVATWSEPDDHVRRLLAAKLDRGLVCDPDQLPREVATMSARVEFRFRGELERCVLTDPAEKPHLPGAISVASPLGALLLGMLEGRWLRSQAPDEAAFVLSVEKVRQPASSRVPAPNEAARRKLAS